MYSRYPTGKHSTRSYNGNLLMTIVVGDTLHVMIPFIWFQHRYMASFEASTNMQILSGWSTCTFAIEYITWKIGTYYICAYIHKTYSLRIYALIAGYNTLQTSLIKLGCQLTCMYMTHYSHFEGILLKGPYLPCVSMAGRALLAGYRGFQYMVTRMYYLAVTITI